MSFSTPVQVKLDFVTQSPGYAYARDCQGVFLVCNEATAHRLNLVHHTFIEGMTLADFMAPADVEKIRQNDLRVLESGKEHFFEEHVVQPDRTVSIFESHKQPLRNAANEIIGIYGISYDVTYERAHGADTTAIQMMRKELDAEIHSKNLAEEKVLYWETTVANLPGNYYSVHMSGEYTSVNANVVKILGFNSAADIVGRSIYQLLPEEIARPLAENNRKVLEEGVPVFCEEVGPGLNGEMAIYDTRKIPVFDPKTGQVTGLIGISLDITERKEMEVSLKAAKEMAEEASQAKSDFIMHMSHDIRTPFSGIIGFSERLAAIETDPEKKKMIGYVLQASKKVLKLLNNIISLVKNEGDTSVKSSVFDVRDVVKDVLDLFAAEAAMKGLSLSWDCEEKVPLQVQSDRTKIERILLNLVGNALKFTHKGSVTVHLGVFERDKDYCELKIVVADTGIGILEDRFKEIFDRFRQLEPDESKREGFGLGLNLVRQFAELLGGYVLVGSKEGVGSEFTCVVSVNIGEKLKLALKNASKAKMVRPAHAKPCSRLLLVEDDFISQVAIKQLLEEEMKCQIDVAGMGEEAISLASERKYDLIVVDLSLPDISGFEVGQRIREETEYQGKIVALSAHIDDSINQKKESAVFDGLLQKPLSIDMVGILYNYL